VSTTIPQTWTFSKFDTKESNVIRAILASAVVVTVGFGIDTPKPVTLRILLVIKLSLPSADVAAARVIGTLAAATSALGNESLITNNFLNVTLSGATSSLGNETVQANADVSITLDGLITGFTGVNVWGNVNTTQTANYSTITITQVPNWSEVA